MMEKYEVICVAAGMYQKKNSYKEYDTESLYLNYGLLGLATNLYDKGYKVRMFQGDSNSPEEVWDKIISEVDISGSTTLFISIPSFYNVKWAADFVRIFRTCYSANSIIAGGRWVVDKNLQWIKDKISEVDFFIKGCPDDIVEEFLDKANWKKYIGICQYNNPFSHLNYTVLADFKRYQPIIEVSRGCSGGCYFCMESQYKACHPKTPVAVLKEVEDICRVYETENLNFYFEGAIFSPGVEWAEDFLREYKKRKMKFHFRMQSRVDTLNPDVLPLLAEAGLKVVDIGLESASPTQLMRMGKTIKPEIYLERAERLLEKAEKCNVWCKINVLLYPGETETTLDETRYWLRKMKNCFKGISCNPLMVYLNGEDTWSYVDELEKVSGLPVDRDLLIKQGYTKVDLSPTLNKEFICEIVNDLYSEFMTYDDYMELKQMTYTPRSQSIFP
jgi:sulfatase maturation enzyme AslB (radical SAM superfamily)